MTELSQVTPHIYRLVIPFLDIYTTVFFVSTEQGAVLFDTGTYPSDIDGYIVPALKELAITPESLKYVIVSHNHRDHGGGLARFAQLYPGTAIVAGSGTCGERVPGRQILTAKDGDLLLEDLQVVSMPGHTADCIGLLDRRTKTLLSGDALQLYGIYGSGNWGANITLIPEHLAMTQRLEQMDIETVIASHDYHPCGFRADGSEAVHNYISQCPLALGTVRGFLQSETETDPQVLADRYNAASGLPTVSYRVIAAVQNAMQSGIL